MRGLIERAVIDRAVGIPLARAADIAAERRIEGGQNGRPTI